jgi:MFS transporter, FHS family, L-fucose permease
MNTKINISKILPVLLAFFVMSFCDLVGLSVDRLKPVLQLSDFQAQFITFFVFIWFFLLSVPVGIMQSRIGKRNMLNIGMGITAAGLFVPFFSDSFGIMLIGFALLGIGNTIVQVSANPLLIDVVPGPRISSFLSFSQFVKAIGSMISPFIAVWIAARFGDWKLLFILYGVVSVISIIWLAAVKIEETAQQGNKVTLSSAFDLMKHKYIILMVMSIFLVVGIDVGFNAHSGQFLMNKFNIPMDDATYGRSVYFFGRLTGTFLGAIMLSWISSRKFFMWTTILGIISFGAFLVVPVESVVWVLAFVIGFAVANIFPLVYSITVEKYPSRGNEVSGLMIMAVSGGAVIPLIMGLISKLASPVIGMSLLLLCMIYLLSVSFYCLKK